MKRALYQIPIDRIEDPTVSSLFVEKQVELDRQLTMLTDRGSHRFLLGSQQLYGPCSPALVRQAEEILERVSSKARGPSSGGSVSDEEIQVRAEAELAEYRAVWDGFKATAKVSKSIAAGLMVSRGQLLVARAVEVFDSPGFVSNRVLLPMINEAVFCLHEGVGSAEDIDTVMKLGMNHPMGPLALADLIGLDVCLDILDVLHTELRDSKYRACPLLVKMVDAGRLGRKSGRGFYDYG